MTDTFTLNRKPAAYTQQRQVCAATGIITPSSVAIRLLKPLSLEEDGFELGHIEAVKRDDYRHLQEAVYSAFGPGRNAKNKLSRGTRFGAYSCDTFSWHDRGTYSLPAGLNPEEGGAIREFDQINDAFLKHPVSETLLRGVFNTWKFEKTSHQQLYQVQLSAIRYEPTIEAPAWPSPVTPHQDMVDGAIVVLNRTENIVGGQSRIYDLDRRPLVQMDLAVGDILFVRDAEVLHQVTPLLLEPGPNWSTGRRAYRDVLLIRFQAVGR